MKLKMHARGFLIAHPWARRAVKRLRRRGGTQAGNPFAFLRHLEAPEGRVFVDAGANVGQSVAALRQLDPDTPIHAFEPMSDSFAALERATAQTAGVHLHKTALTDTPGSFTLYTPCYDGRPMGPLASIDRDEAALWLERFGGMFINPRKVTVREETVEATRLDDYDLAPSFVKIDVQGVAPQLLRGAEATLAAHKPVLFVERGKNDGVAEQLAPLSYRDYVLENGRLVPYSGQPDSILVADDSVARLTLPIA